MFRPKSAAVHLVPSEGRPAPARRTSGGSHANRTENVGAVWAVSKPGSHHLAMGQNPVPPVNIPIPTKIGSKMGGEFTYPRMVPLVLTHSHFLSHRKGFF